MSSFARDCEDMRMNMEFAGDIIRFLVCVERKHGFENQFNLNLIGDVVEVIKRYVVTMIMEYVNQICLLV